MRPVFCGLLLAALLGAGCRSGGAPPPPPDGRTLRGRVVYAEGGAPAVAALVELPGLGAQTRTDSLGRFELRGVPPGAHRLRVRRVGYRAADEVLRVPRGADAIVRVTLEAPVLCLDDCRAPPTQPRSRVEVVP